MNEEKLRIAILKALGWTQTDFGSWITPGGDPAFDSGLFDPLASRDAAISAVIELCDTGPKQIKYGIALDAVLTADGVDCPAWFEFSVATPLQICTALAKALSLEVQE